MIKKLMFRMLRGEIVMRMYMMKMTWATINKVLMSMGQDIVLSYENQPSKGGILLQFGKPNTQNLLRARALNRKTNKK